LPHAPRPSWASSTNTRDILSTSHRPWRNQVPLAYRAKVRNLVTDKVHKVSILHITTDKRKSTWGRDYFRQKKNILRAMT
jgi:hypothetical protein